MQFTFWYPKPFLMARKPWQGYFRVYALGDNQQESPLTHLKLISYSNRRRPNWSHTTPKKSKISNQVKNPDSLFAGCCLPQTNHLLLSGNTMRKEVGDSFSFFRPFSLCLCWTGSKLTALVRAAQHRAEENRAGQHTGLHNLITCFICRNLFLNQSGWGRKPSSWAVIYTSLSRCSGTSDTALPLWPCSHWVSFI